ncbi:hypothetical protein ABR748_36315 [Streptomyces microflavus]|uniref:Uncharacterized protein n=1 Tax=Streptomyces microflavus TaxID=1919 RepID=A0ABV1QEK3_STRMI
MKRPGKSPGNGAADVAASFVREKLGIRSVATTHHTDALTAQTLTGGDTSSSRTVFNPDIDAMTTQALRLAVGDYLAHSERAEGGRGSLAGHIHLSWSSDDRQMFALAEARREVGWHTPGLTSLHLLSGCAGMIEALNYAQYLLYHSTARDDEDAVVFVTASNDLSAIAHTRGPAEAPGNEDLDQWLFPAIFGEGAGAIVIGRPDPAGDEWMVQDWAIEPVTEDWRVTMPPEQDIPHMVIRARGVGATYRTNVPLAAQRGLQASATAPASGTCTGCASTSPTPACSPRSPPVSAHRKQRCTASAPPSAPSPASPSSPSSTKPSSPTGTSPGPPTGWSAH